MSDEELLQAYLAEAREMVLQTASALADIIKVIPSVEDLETENFETQITLLLAGDPDPDQLCSDIAKVSEVEQTGAVRLTIEEALEIIGTALAPAEKAKPPPFGEQSKDHTTRYYRLELSFEPTIVEEGTDPLMYLVELQEYGRILENYINIAKLPDLKDLNPTKLHIFWTLFYETRLSPAKLEEIFTFVRKKSTINIEEITGELNEWFEGDKKTGELLVERGLVSKDATLSKEEIQRLIFMPGFSTAKQITDVSGRGVGLDVVISNIKNLQGSVDLVSEKGQGTTIAIKLPLTLAIIDGMMVRVGNERYIIPLTSITEFIKAKPDDIHQAEGKGLLLHLRSEYIPYASLYQYRA